MELMKLMVIVSTMMYIEQDDRGDYNIIDDVGRDLMVYDK